MYNIFTKEENNLLLKEISEHFESGKELNIQIINIVEELKKIQKTKKNLGENCLLL